MWSPDLTALGCDRRCPPRLPGWQEQLDGGLLCSDGCVCSGRVAAQAWTLPHSARTARRFATPTGSAALNAAPAGPPRSPTGYPAVRIGQQQESTGSPSEAACLALMTRTGPASTAGTGGTHGTNGGTETTPRPDERTTRRPGISGSETVAGQRRTGDLGCSEPRATAGDSSGRGRSRRAVSASQARRARGGCRLATSRRLRTASHRPWRAPWRQ